MSIRDLMTSYDIFRRGFPLKNNHVFTTFVNILVSCYIINGNQVTSTKVKLNLGKDMTTVIVIAILKVKNFLLTCEN